MRLKIYVILSMTIIWFIVMMNNNIELDFWFFNHYTISLWKILLGNILVGFILAKLLTFKKSNQQNIKNQPEEESFFNEQQKPTLSDEDRDFLS